MPTDLREALWGAAATPQREPDLERIVRRGYRHRRQKAAVVAVGAVAAIALPVAGIANRATIEPPVVEETQDPATSPIDDLFSECRDAIYDFTAFFRAGATRAEMRQAAASLRKLPGVFRVQRVGRRQGFDELRKLFDREELPEHAFPGWVNVGTQAYPPTTVRLARRMDLLEDVAKVVIVDVEQQNIRCRFIESGSR